LRPTCQHKKKNHFGIEAYSCPEGMGPSTSAWRKDMRGHSSIKMTMDTYGHLWKDDAADQALAVAIERQLG